MRARIPRAGVLTEDRLAYILKCVKRCPFHLDRAARAAGLLPSELFAWYQYGQSPTCADNLCAELALEIAQIQFDRTCQNQDRIDARADGGDMRAIELLEKKAEESDWNRSPDDRMLAALSDALSGELEDASEETGGELGKAEEAPKALPAADSDPA